MKRKNYYTFYNYIFVSVARKNRHKTFLFVFALCIVLFVQQDLILTQIYWTFMLINNNVSIVKLIGALTRK